MWWSDNGISLSVKAKAEALAAKATSRPMPLDYVNAFCGEVDTSIKRDNWGVVVESKRSCHCPKGEGCKDFKETGGIITFPNGSGFSNVLTHLRACPLKGKSDEEILKKYWIAKVYQQEREKTQTTLGSFCTKKPKQVAPMLNTRDMELFDWIEMIVMESLPLSAVTSEMYRRKFKHKFKFGPKTVREVLLAMTLIVEGKLSAEMKEARRGSIVHDGWTKFGTHFLALFATYRAKREKIVNGVLATEVGTVMSLLSVSPLIELEHMLEDSQDDDDEFTNFLDEEEDRSLEKGKAVAEAGEAVEFTADIHAGHIVDILESFYDIKVDEWVTNQTADSCSVNLKVARLLDIPHVNCENHLLNNQVKCNVSMTVDENVEDDETYGVGTVLNIIHKTMKEIKGSIKISAALRKKTHLAPTIGNDTRWSSHANMLNKYWKISEPLKLLSLDKTVKCSMPPFGPAFDEAAKTAMLQFQDIDAITKVLQTRLLPLSECVGYTQRLIQTVDTGMEDATSHWHFVNFDTSYIDPSSPKRANPVFVSAVCKMQKRLGSTLTMAEKRAIKMWLPRVITTPNDGNNGKTLAEQLKSEQHRKRKVTDELVADNMNTVEDHVLDHVIGSAAEVERLWSIAKHILTDTRSKMAPIVFEAILFLRFNRDIWNEFTVVDALNAVRVENKDKRLTEKLAMASGHDGDEPAEEAGVAADAAMAV